MFKLITHPHETTLDDDQLSVIPGTPTASFELETVELKSAEIWSNKFVTLNTKLEICERERLAKEQKWKDMGNLEREDNFENLE